MSLEYREGNECEDMLREVEEIEKMEIEIRQQEMRIAKKRKMKDIMDRMSKEEEELDEMVS